MRITIWTTLTDDHDGVVVKAFGTARGAEDHLLTWMGVTREAWEAWGGTHEDLHDMYELKHGWSHSTFSIDAHELDLPEGQLQLPLR